MNVGGMRIVTWTRKSTDKNENATLKLLNMFGRQDPP